MLGKITDHPRGESLTDDPQEEPITENAKRTLSLRTLPSRQLHVQS